MRTYVLWAFIIILIGIMFNIISCGSCDNKFIGYYGLIGNSGGSGGGGNLGSGGAVNIWAQDLNQGGWVVLSNVYKGGIFDGINYYLSGFQEDTTKKYAIVKLNPDLTLNYGKYYTVSGSTDIGLTNLYFNPNDSTKLYVGGWHNGAAGNGIIAEIDKNTGNLTIIKAYSNTGSINLITDSTHLYGVSVNGYIMKLNLSNLSIVDSKQINGYNFSSISQNNSYIATYNVNSSSYGVVAVKKDFSSATLFKTNGNQNQVPLIDSDNNMYLIDKSTDNNLVIAKINLNDNSLDISKEYTLSLTSAYYSGIFLDDGSMLVAIESTDLSNRFLQFFKINRNDLSLVSKVRVLPKQQLSGNYPIESIESMTLFTDFSGGFFAAGILHWDISEGDVSISLDIGYALKMPSNFNLDPNNCVFNTTYNIPINSANYNYNIDYTNMNLDNSNLNLNEISSLSLTSQNLNTFVGCIDSSNPNILNKTIQKNKK